MKLSLKNFSASELHVKAEASITEDHVIRGTGAETHSKTICSFPVFARRAEGLTLEQHEKVLLTEAEELLMRMYEDIVCGDGKIDAHHSDPQWSVKLQPCGDSKFSMAGMVVGIDSTATDDSLPKVTSTKISQGFIG